MMGETEIETKGQSRIRFSTCPATAEKSMETGSLALVGRIEAVICSDL
jgi:hypothetical protein